MSLGDRRLKLVAVAVAMAALLTTVVVAAATSRAAGCTVTELKVGVVQAKNGCFSQVSGKPDTYESSGSFLMNGIRVEPANPDSKVTFNTQASRGTAGYVETSGRVNLSAAPRLGSWQPPPLAFSLGGFSLRPPPTGELTLAESTVDWGGVVWGLVPTIAKQPIVLSDDGTSSFEVAFGLNGALKTALRTDKEVTFGLNFGIRDGTFRITGGKGSVSGFTIANMFYVNEATVAVNPPDWSLDLDANLGNAPKVKLPNAPSDSKGLSVAVEVKNSRLQRIGAGLSGFDLPIGNTGVLWTGASIALTTDPWSGSGRVSLAAGPKVPLFKGSDPVRAVKADAGVALQPAVPARQIPGFFKIDGNMKLVDIPLANGALTVRWDQVGFQSASLLVSAGIGIPCLCNRSSEPTYLGGRLTGWTNARSFDLTGEAQLKVLGVNLLGAQAVVSDVGMAGCVRVIWWIGGGVRWANGRGEMLGGWTCNIGGYRRAPDRLAAGLGGDNSTPLRLPEEARVIRVMAAEGEEAPELVLESRNGTALETPEEDDPNGIQRFDGEGASLSDVAGTAEAQPDGRGMSAFILPEDAPQRWTLSEQAGSSEVEIIEYAGELPPAEVEAEVVGEGRHRTLRWSARDIPYQTLQFSEVTPSGREVPILETDDSEGRRRFLPVEGAGTWGERKLAVDVRQRHDTPRDELVADRYVVRKLDAPAPVARVTAHQSLTDLHVRWRRAQGARSYEVNGRVVGKDLFYSRTVPGNRRGTVLHDVSTARRMRVRVVPINVQGRRGGAGVKTIRTAHRVESRGEAATRLLDRLSATKRGLLASILACPANGHCYGSLKLEKRGRVIGTARFEVPQGMSERILVQPPRRLTRRLSQGGVSRGVRATATVAQVQGRTVRRQVLTLRR